MKTTRKNDLKKQIAELTAKAELQERVENKLPFIDPEKIYTNEFNYKKRGTKYTFTVRLNSEGHPFNKIGIPFSQLRETIKNIVHVFPPTNKTTVYLASEDVPTAANFVLKWDNSCTGRYKASIEWVSGEFDCQIDLPIDFYSNDVKGVFQRHISDSEYHYFPGTGYTELRRRTFTAYKLDMFEHIKYYGGNVTNYAKYPEQVAEFEHVVLNGHTPQFADFWQKELERMDEK
jgi:hypothetical protein